MTKLDDAIAKILAEAEPDSWTELCKATIELGAALAKFDAARKKYVESQKDTFVHECTYNRSRKLWVIKSTLGPTSLQVTRDKKPTATDLEGDYAYLDSKLRKAHR